MKRKVKLIWGIVLAICLILYIVYSSGKPLDVELIQVQPQTIAQTFKEEGIVYAATERSVYSLISGKVVEVNAKAGQRVKKGDILFKLDIKDLEFQKQQLKGQLESIKGQELQTNKSPYASQIMQQQLVIDETKRQLETSRESYNKLKSLYDNGAATKQEFDDALSAVKQIENSLLQQNELLELIKEQSKPLPGTSQYFQGQIQSINAQLNHLDYQISNSKIIAPIDGIITDVNIKEGSIVNPQLPLATLTTQNDFEVRTYLLTEDVVSIKEGMQVKLIQERKNGDLEFKGYVKTIAPSAEEKISALGLAQQKVKITIAPDTEIPDLRQGYALDVHFTTLEQYNKLVVPKVVLFPYENFDAVWTVKDGKAVITKIEKGMETDESVVIESGLVKEDQVIKNPQLEGLKQGKRVK